VTIVADHCAAGLAWCEAGTGDPTVFLHGLGGSRTAWAEQLPALSDDRRCIAWDMPGYGDSDPLGTVTFEAVADRLIDLIDALGTDRVDLVGLSLGGMHALHAVLRHPERIRRLVLSNTSPRFGLDGTTPADWTAARLATLDDGRTMRERAPFVLDRLVGSPLPAARRAELIESFARIPEPGFRAAVACLPSHDVLDQLGDIRHPTLVIAGELDTETPPSYSRALVDGIPGAKLVMFAGVGHLAPSEHPHMFNQIVRDFLDDEEPSDR
jgi:pimeloyl-ACP methyl ester carboxylesterase